MIKTCFRRLWLLVAIFAAISSSAQTAYEEVVYLKNGSIIKGVIIETVPNVSYKVKTKDGNIFVFKSDEVEKIVKEEVTPAKKERATLAYKQKGFSSIEETGASFLIGKSETTTLFSLHSVNGYLFNPHLFVGLGAGIEADEITAIIPLYLESRAYLTKGKVSPYFGLGGGYGLMYINQGSNIGGPLAHALAGLRIHLGEKASFNISVGYRLHNYKQMGLAYNGKTKQYEPRFEGQNSSNLFCRIGCTF